MASRIFHYVRKELLHPMLEPKPRFSSGPSGSSGSSGSSSSKTKPELTQNEERTLTVLKVMAVFLPGVYIGHVMTEHGLFKNSEDNENGEDEKNGDKDAKDKNGKGKDKKAKEK